MMYQSQYQQQVPQSYYLGTAGHRATSSYSYVPNYSANTIQHHQANSINGGSYPQHYMPSVPNHAPAHLQAPHGNYCLDAPHIAVPADVPPPAAAAPAAEQAVAAAPEPEFNGGITSVLEYNINNMSTFLSWCTFGILKQNRNPTKEFDNMVVSILFATRLPKSTIIIALEYMNQRYSNKKVSSLLSESEIFTVLVVSLILANKFNDDNTFTNRSWCGAAGLAIELINYEEKEWLNEVKWQLNVVNFEDNIRTLEECWVTWLEKYTSKSKQPSIRSASGSSAPQSEASSMPSSATTTYSSIPSSPVSYDNGNGYYASSPINSSPIKYSHDSIWSHSSSIWSYTPQYQYMAGNGAAPAPPLHHHHHHHQQPQPQHQHQPQQPQLHHQQPQQQPIYHHIQQPYVDPSIQFLNQSNGFVGYGNPYYTYNMASC